MANTTVLNEDMFNNPINKKIDGEWESILDQFISKETPHVRPDLIPAVNEAFDKLSKDYSKLIKSKVTLHLLLGNNPLKANDQSQNDKKVPMIVHAAYTYIKKPEIKSLKKQISKIVISKKDGYHAVQLPEINIYIELANLLLIKYPELYRINPDKFKYNKGRMMNAIVLHEIGHHIFLPFMLKHKNVNNSKYMEVQFPDNQKPLMINEGESDFQDMIPTIILKISTCVLLTYINMIQCAGSGLLNFIFGNMGNLGYMPVQNKFYRQENGANEMSIQYGYYKEIAIFRIMFKIYYGNFNRQFKTHNSKFDKLFNKIDYNNRITNSILQSLKRESDNQNNTPSQRKQITSSLISIKKMQDEVNNSLQKYQDDSEFIDNSTPRPDAGTFKDFIKTAINNH